jgi:hypothetical protein
MSQEKSQRNRRLSFRKPFRGRVRVTCRKGGLDLGVNLVAATLNVSESGVRLLLTAGLPRGQEVTVNLEGQDHLRPVRILGNVAWTRADGEKWETGIQFQKRLKYMDFLRLT